MPRHSALTALTVGVFLTGCASKPVDDARPVVTPSVTVSPSVAGPGSQVQFALKFAVAPDAPAFPEDYVVFLHVIDDGGRMIGTADHAPPTPTQAWKAGSTIEYTHRAYAPMSRYVGEADVVVGLYSPKTGERVPLAGEVFEPRAVKAGRFEMRERTDPYLVTFREGWHPAESPSGSGLEMRWSTKSGTLSFPNPRKDVELVLEVDQPHRMFPIPQHIEVKHGDSVLDGFDLEAGPSHVRRIALGPAALGDADSVELAVVSDKTFVPANVTELGSADSRQLGVRVIRAYIEPKQ